MLLIFNGGGDIILIFEMIGKVFVEDGGGGIIKCFNLIFKLFLINVGESGGGEMI